MKSTADVTAQRNWKWPEEERAEQRARDEAQRHVDRWWATYNAALTGMLANPANNIPSEDIDHRAWSAANFAHGPLPKESP